MIQAYREEVEVTAHALAAHHAKIKAFVKRYHERASTLLTLAAKSCAGNSSAGEELLQEASCAQEVDEAVELARALGPAAAPIVPEIITAYYGGSTIDAFV